MIAPPTGGVSVTDEIVADELAALVTLAVSGFVVPRGMLEGVVPIA